MISTIKSNWKLYIIWALILVLCAMSVIWSGIFSLAAFALFAIAAVFFKTNDVFAILIGIMPFANIFKIGPNSTSFFTICGILIVGICIFNYKKFKTSFVASIVFLTAYLIFFSMGNLNALLIVKIIINFFIIYFATNILQKNDITNIAYMFSISVLIMLILSLNSNFFTHLIAYFEDINYYVDSSGSVSKDLIRNGGFLGDPNYCSMLVLVSLSLLAVLYYHKTVGIEFWIISIPTIILGFTTYSKSYFLCIAVFVVMLMFMVLYAKHKIMFALSVIGLIGVISLAISGKIEFINLILDRFNMKDLTTGRDELNVDFINYIFSNFKTMLFGESISSDRFVGAKNNVHNMYIELLFRVGILGSLLFVFTLIFSFNHPETAEKTQFKLVNLIPLLFILVMYTALAGVTGYELAYYMIIAYVAFNYNKLPKSQNVNIEG